MENKEVTFAAITLLLMNILACTNQITQSSQKLIKASVSGDINGDTTPSGMVAFVSGNSCPLGWIVPESAQGRLIIGVADPASVGITVDAPLENKTPPTHSHAFTVNLVMNYQSVSAASFGNHSGAAAKTYSVSGTLATNTANLPFLQLPVCQKQ